jgi:hypothetical protein
MGGGVAMGVFGMGERKLKDGEMRVNELIGRQERTKTPLACYRTSLQALLLVVNM